MLQIHDCVWFIWPVWILILPVSWLLSAAAAACFHELGHIIAVKFSGGCIRGIRIKPFGVVIDVSSIEGYREVVCSLAGPLFSLLLGFVIRIFPMLGFCGLMQGVFNLLPVYPMDGGRVLSVILRSMIPDYAEKISFVVEITFIVVFLLLMIFCMRKYSLGVFPSLFLCVWTVNVLLRKKP